MDGIANRYAIALLAIAREDKKIKDYIKEMESIRSIFQENEGLIELLKSYGLSTEEKKDVLTKIFSNKIDEYILNLFYVMIDNSRGKYILPVCDEFIRIALNELKIRKGIVYTTIKLDKKQLSAMEDKVSKMLNCTVQLTNEIDNSIIGGFKIQVDDYIIDDTMKTRIANLKDTIILKKGENV